MPEPTQFGMQRDFGRMEGELVGLRADMADLKKEMKAMRSAFDEVKGGSRVIIGVAAAIGGLISWAGQWFLGKWHP